jgi:hypothetical protein
VKEYDAATGTFLGNFISEGSGGLDRPSSLLLGLNGNLLVVSQSSNEVKEYKINPGEFLGNFVSAGDDGPTLPETALFVNVPDNTQADITVLEKTGEQVLQRLMGYSLIR